MQPRADLADFDIFSGWIYAICEQNHEKVLLRIDPQRCSGKSIVSIALRRKIFPGGRWLDRHIPSERARRFASLHARRKLRHDFTLKQPVMRVDAAIQH